MGLRTQPIVSCLDFFPFVSLSTWSFPTYHDLSVRQHLFIFSKTSVSASFVHHFKISWPNLALISIASVVPCGLWPASCKGVWSTLLQVATCASHFPCSVPIYAESRNARSYCSVEQTLSGPKTVCLTHQRNYWGKNKGNEEKGREERKRYVHK